MNGQGRWFWAWLCSLTGIALFLTGCATPRIDWNSRIGSYTYDEAVLEQGPPDKLAKLNDGTTVADWLTRKGSSYAYAPFGYSYSPWWYAPAPVYVDTFNSPDAYLRLTFGPDGRLRAWKKLYR